MKRLLIFVFLTFAMSAMRLVEAADWHHYISANLTSYHFNRDKNYNEVNPGLGYEGVYGSFRILGGAYYNSFKRWTGYALGGLVPLRLQVTQNSQLAAGLVLGAASGYQEVNLNNTSQKEDKNNLGIIPVGGILLAWEPIKARGIGINILVTPPLKKYDISGFAGLQVKFSF